MMKVSLYGVLIVIVFCLSSCFYLKEGVKKFSGTSTQDLEQSRGLSIQQTYVCGFDECFDAILRLARIDENGSTVNEKGVFNIFQQDSVYGIVVVMGIAGSIDTTEVGIFLTMLDDRNVRIEVSSLSSAAKIKVAKTIFKEIAFHFDKAK